MTREEEDELLYGDPEYAGPNPIGVLTNGRGDQEFAPKPADVKPIRLIGVRLADSLRNRLRCRSPYER